MSDGLKRTQVAVTAQTTVGQRRTPVSVGEKARGLPQPSAQTNSLKGQSGVLCLQHNTLREQNITFIMFLTNADPIQETLLRAEANEQTKSTRRRSWGSGGSEVKRQTAGKATSY